MVDATAPADFASWRHADYSRLRDALQQRLDQSDEVALAFAQALIDRTWTRRHDDPTRGDAIEMLTRVHLAAQRFAEASAWSADVVRIRRAASPPDPLMLAMALGLDATVAFALERSEDADAGFRESLLRYREAFPDDDLRLAKALEDYAEFVQRGFGREPYVTELLREAMDIRDADGRTPPGKLAERLMQLCMGELRAGEFEQADRHLDRLVDLLTAETSSPRSNDTLRAMRVQGLVLQGGLAARLARRDQVDRCMEAARAVRLDDEALQFEMRFTVDEAAGMQLEMMDDRAAATELQWRLVEAMGERADLFASGVLDPAWQGDNWLRLATLLTADGDLEAADMLLELAEQRLGETSEVFFARAEMKQKAGRVAEALADYQSALRLRKEGAAEMNVLFGTSRCRVEGVEEVAFTSRPADGLTLGTASVIVPGGMFGTEAWLTSLTPANLPVGMATNPARLFLRRKTVLDVAEFDACAAAVDRAGHLYGGALLVFVHGFNVSFDDAMRRGAQLMRDLNFDGALAVFSWPSQGALWRYGTDRRSADAAADRLIEFLDRLARADRDGPIHIVAHSMGNRVLLPALAKIAATEGSPVRGRLAEIVLAAPAVPVQEFNGWLDALAASGCAARFTLYASKADKAMWAGFLREGFTTLAGYASNGAPLLHRHVQSIDISRAAQGEVLDLNHDVFASNPVMSEDIRQLLQTGSKRDPQARLPTIMAVSTCTGADAIPWWSYDPEAHTVEA